MYRVTTGIHAHFAHHVRGHSGPCISLHGHTWKLELALGASSLDAQGFVVDFDLVNERVLDPCHRLLDHALALGEKSYSEVRDGLAGIGRELVRSRLETLGDLGECPFHLEGTLGAARNELPGGIKVAVFPFNPTSERLAEWLYEVARHAIADERVQVVWARVYESLHPVDTYAEYAPG